MSELTEPEVFGASPAAVTDAGMEPPFKGDSASGSASSVVIRL